MADLHEHDQEFLDELSKKAVSDPHVQLLLYVLAEMNSALAEKRDLKKEYRPTLALLMAAHGASEVDIIRFTASLE